MEGNPAPSLVVRIVSGPAKGRSVPLEPGRRVRIGRSPPPPEGGAPAADLVIDDRKLSRLHCEVLPVVGGWEIRDAGSSNGTFLNGERVAEAAIRPGDLVQAGNVVLEIADPAAPPSPARAPAAARPGPLRRRRPSRRGSPALTGGILVGVAAAAAVAAAVVLRGRGREQGPETAAPSATSPAPERGGPTTIAAPPRPARAIIRPDPEAAAAAEVPIEVVASFLDARDYRRALDYLDDLAGRREGFDPGPLRGSVLDRAAADLAAAEEEAGRRFRSGNVAAAEPLEEIALRIPDELAAEASAALERVNGIREAIHDHERKAAAGTSSVRAALARLDFAEAGRLVDGMDAARKAAAGPASDTDPGTAAEAALRREIRLAERAWKLIEGALDARVRDGAAIRLSFADAADAGGLEAGSFRIVKREEDELALERAGGGARQRAAPAPASLFALDGASLKALLGPGADRDPEAIEGLALLLLYRAGPARAEAFAGGENALEPARRDALIRLCNAAGDLWLLARRDAILRAASRLSAEKSREPWEDLCRRIGALARAWRGRPGYDRERAALVRLFVQTRVEVLKRDGLRGIFSAARAELEGSRIRLVYDFSTGAELADFEKGLGQGSSVERQGGHLVLRGECRLFSGDPFEGSLTVRGRAPRGGFDPAAPNIAVGLFTRERERLRIEGRGPLSLFALLAATNGPEPGDYVVFALGYRTAVADYGGKPMENLYLSGQEDPIPLPAHAILFGRRGAPLHTDARECLWAVQAAPIGGALSFEVAAAPGRLEWKINGRTLAGGEPALERWNAGGARTGSVTLLTRAEEVRLSLLEVEGDLRDAWLAERLEGEGLRAFRQFDPDA